MAAYSERKPSRTPRAAARSRRAPSLSRVSSRRRKWSPAHCSESDCYEVHHVNKLKNLKGKQAWEVAMIAKRRKTLVVCKKCHVAIHNQ